MNAKTTGLLGFALVLILAVGVMTFTGNNSSKSPSNTPSTQEVREVKEMYKDGVYTQLGTYKSPAGPEEIEVKLTLKKDIIVEAEVTVKAENKISKAKQDAFVANYKEMVVGKNIKDLSLGKVAGASLTPKGFNDAVEKIKGAAKS